MTIENLLKAFVGPVWYFDFWKKKGWPKVDPNDEKYFLLFIDALLPGLMTVNGAVGLILILFLLAA